MIHILLLILKIIGIILLAVLGLLFLLLLAVLFIPVRYKAEGSCHDGTPEFSGRVSWFFRLLTLRAQYSSGGLACSLKVLGIRLWHNHNKDAAQDLEEGAETILGEEEQTLYEELAQDEENYQRDQKAGKGSGEAFAAKGDAGRESGGAAAAKGDASRETGGAAAPSGSRDGEEKTPGLPAACRRFAGSMVRKVKHILEKLKFSFKRICDKLKGFREFTEDKRQWLEDGKNQASLRLLYRQARRLLIHLWPRKGRGAVTFGFDDPYTTGQVLEAASLIYPFCHRHLSLYPVFDEKVLEGEGSFEGRIRLSFILWLAVQILLDVHTRRMIRGFLK